MRRRRRHSLPSPLLLPLLLLPLTLLLLLPVAARAQLPALPDSLEAPELVRANGSFHASGVYALPRARPEARVRFVSPAPGSVFRAAASLLGASTVSLAVYSTGALAGVASCPRAEDACDVYAVLPSAGEYELLVQYSAASAGALRLEAALAAPEAFAALAKAQGCGKAPGGRLPSPAAVELDNDKAPRYAFRAGWDDGFAAAADRSRGGPVVLLDVPVRLSYATADRSGAWELFASLDSSFLASAAALELVLTSLDGDVSARHLLLCRRDPDHAAAACVGSAREGANRQAVRATLAAGRYRLVLVATPLPGGAAPPLPVQCTRLGLELEVGFVRSAPAPACDGDHFPASLNHAALLGEDGRASVFERFRFSASTLDHEVSLSVARPSVMRVVLSHPRLRLDLALYDSRRDQLFRFELLHSAPGGGGEVTRDEGVFTYLMPGNYTLILSLDEEVLPPASGLCTLVNVALEVAPYAYGTDDYKQRQALCEGGDSAPSPDTRKATGEEPFSYASDATLRFGWSREAERVLVSIPLTLHAEAMVRASAGYEFLHGDLNLRLAPADMRHNATRRSVLGAHGERVTRFADGHQSLTAKGLAARLPPGDYVLDVVAGPSQAEPHFSHTTADFDEREVRGCGLYSFRLAVTPAAAPDPAPAAQPPPPCPDNPAPASLDLAPGGWGGDSHRLVRAAVPALRAERFGRLDGEVSVRLRVGARSRVRVEALAGHPADRIELQLVPGGGGGGGQSPAVWGVSGEEEFGDRAEAVLDAGDEHTLVVRYIVPNMGVRGRPECPHFVIEAASAPEPDSPAAAIPYRSLAMPDPHDTPAGCVPPSPHAMPFPIPAAYEWGASFRFRPPPAHPCRVLHTEGFVVTTRATEFRATLRFDFAALPLSLRLVRREVDGDYRVYSARAEAGTRPGLAYNRRYIASALLSPGAYTVEVTQSGAAAEGVHESRLVYDLEMSWRRKEDARGRAVDVPPERCVGSLPRDSPHVNRTVSVESKAAGEASPVNFLRMHRRVHSTEETATSAGEPWLRLVRFLPVRRTRSQHLVMFAVDRPSFFRVYLSQEAAEHVHTKVRVRAMGGGGGGGGGGGAVRVESTAVAEGVRADAERFGLSSGAAGRLLEPGRYYVEVAWTGEPLHARRADLPSGHSGCARVVRLDLAVVPVADALLREQLMAPACGQAGPVAALEPEAPLQLLPGGPPLAALSRPFPRHAGFQREIEVRAPPGAAGSLLSVDVSVDFVAAGALEAVLEGPEGHPHARRVHLAVADGGGRLFLANHTLEAGGSYRVLVRDPWRGDAGRCPRVTVRGVLHAHRARAETAVPVDGATNAGERSKLTAEELREHEALQAVGGEEGCERFAAELPQEVGAGEHQRGRRVVVAGDGYAMPTEHEEARVHLHVTVPSLVRVWVRRRSNDHEIELALHSDDGAASSDESLMAYNEPPLGLGSAERTLRAYLHPKEEPYMLLLRQEVLDDSESPLDADRYCHTFSMVVAIEPVADAERDLKCPDKPSPPPARLAVPPAGTSLFASYSMRSGDMRKYVQEHGLADSPHPGLFRHRIALEVSTGDDSHLTAVDAVVGYNLALSNFRLSLKSASTGAELAHSSGSASGAGSSLGRGLTFAHALEVAVPRGRYFLDVEEDAATNPHLAPLHVGGHGAAQSERCFPLLLGLEAYPNVNGRRPYVEAVRPAGGLNLDPASDLEVAVRFSVDARLNANGVTSHEGNMAASGAVVLRTLRGPAADGSGVVTPSALRFAPRDPSTLLAVFPAASLGHDRSYRLEVDLSKFRSADGRGFGSFEPFLRHHVYHFGHAEWHLNPAASASSAAAAGAAAPPHHAAPAAAAGGASGAGVGPEVGAFVTCSPGWHLAGRRCVANTACRPDSCSGHGLCDDSAGFPECACFPGFASAGGRPCGACDSPRHRYPECLGEEEADDEMHMSGVCTSAILPYSLNAPGLLSPQARHAEGEPDGGPSVHLAGWYHVNLDAGMHATRFELRVTSVFRAYVASDESVRLALYRGAPGAAAAPGGDDMAGASLVASGSAGVPKESGVFQVLAPGRYTLAFMFGQNNYYGGRSACPQLNLELAVEPLAASRALPFAVEGGGTVCSGRADRVPEFRNQHPNAPAGDAPAEVHEHGAVPHPHDSATHKVVRTVDFHPVPPAGFAYRSPSRAGARLALRARGSARSAFEFPFRVPEVMHRQAYLVAHLEHDFLLGQYRMSLAHHMRETSSAGMREQVPGSGTMGAAFVTFDTTKFADIASNQNLIRMPLPPGEFTLRVFETVAQNASLTACAPFDFRFHVGFVRLPHHYQKSRAKKFHEWAGTAEEAAGVSLDAQFGGDLGLGDDEADDDAGNAHGDTDRVLAEGHLELPEGHTALNGTHYLDHLDRVRPFSRAGVDETEARVDAEHTAAGASAAGRRLLAATAAAAGPDSGEGMPEGHADDWDDWGEEEWQEGGGGGAFDELDMAADERHLAGLRADADGPHLGDAFEEPVDVPPPPLGEDWEGGAAAGGPEHHPVTSALGTRSQHASSGHKQHLSRSAAVPMAEELLDEECALRPLPSSFNQPGMLGRAGARMALFDRFRYDASGHAHDIPFRVVPFGEGVRSLVRVSLPFRGAGLHIRAQLLSVDRSRAAVTGKVHMRALAALDNAVDDTLHAAVGGGEHVLRLEFDVHFSDYESERSRAATLEQLACLGFAMAVWVGPQPAADDTFARTHSYARGPAASRDALPVLPGCPAVPMYYHAPAIPGSATPLGGPTRPLPFRAVRHFVRERDGSWRARAAGDEWRRVADYPIEVRYAGTILEVEVDSDFGRGEVGAAWRRIGDVGETDAAAERVSDDPADGDHTGASGNGTYDRERGWTSHVDLASAATAHNRHSLLAELRPGRYALSFVLLSSPDELDFSRLPNATFHIDVPYEFDVRVRLLEEPDEVHQCLARGHEVLSHSFNTPRWLGTATAPARGHEEAGAVHVFARFLLPAVHLHTRRGHDRHAAEEVRDEREARERERRADADGHDHGGGGGGGGGGGSDSDDELFDMETGEAVFAPAGGMPLGAMHDRAQLAVYHVSVFRLSVATPAGEHLRVTLTEFPCRASGTVAARRRAGDGLGGPHCRPQRLFSRETDGGLHEVRFLAPGLYELEVRQLSLGDASHSAGGEQADSSHTAADPCASYEMELAVEPLAAYQHYHPSTQCRGADHWPPAPPDHVRKPYHYDSRQLGADHFVQQREGQPRARTMFFTVDRAFRLYSELDYDFLAGDLTMDLMLADPARVSSHAGLRHQNRHVLALDYLPPGRYVLTLREPAGGALGWFCAEFAFSLEIHPITVQAGAVFGFGTGAGGSRGLSVYEDPLTLLSPMQRVVPPFPHLPPTLDSMAFLAARGSCHFFGTYSLLHRAGLRAHHHAHSTTGDGGGGVGADDTFVHAPELENVVRFTVARPSVVRAYGAPHRSGGTSTDFSVLLSLRPHRHRGQTDVSSEGSRVQVLSGNADDGDHLGAYSWVLAVVQPGRYELRAEAVRARSPAAADGAAGAPEPEAPHSHHSSRWFDWGLAFPADVEVAVQQLGGEDADGDGGVPRQPGGEGEAPAGITLAGDSTFFHFASSELRMCGADAAGAGQNRLHEVPLSTDAHAVVFVEVGYDFLENHLLLSLEGTELGGRRRSWSSLPHLNSNQLYVTVPPGHYRIVVHSFGVLPAATTRKVSAALHAAMGCSRLYSMAVFAHQPHADAPSHFDAPADLGVPAHEVPASATPAQHPGEGQGSAAATASVAAGGCPRGLALPLSVVVPSAAESDDAAAAGADRHGDHVRRGQAALVGGVYVHNSHPGADRTFRVHGEGMSFGTPLEVRWQWIKMPVLADSVMRVDTRTSSDAASVRLVLFRNSNQTVEPDTEIGTAQLASHVYRLPPSPLVYFLGVGSLVSAGGEPCPTFSLDLAVVTETSLRTSLLARADCPKRLPDPELEVTPGGYASQNLPDGSWQGTSHSMEVPIRFRVVRHSYVSAHIRHNFVTAAYSLTLERRSRLGGQVHYIVLSSTERSMIPDERSLRHGQSPDATVAARTSPLSVVADSDFRVSLGGYIEPGEYTLFLREHLGPAHQRMLGSTVPACHRFAWDLKVEPDLDRQPSLPSSVEAAAGLPSPSASGSGSGPGSRSDPESDSIELTPMTDGRATDLEHVTPIHPHSGEGEVEVVGSRAGPGGDSSSRSSSRGGGGSGSKGTAAIDVAVAVPAVSCRNGGRSVDGACVCVAGYAGARCERCAGGYHKNPRSLRFQCIVDKQAQNRAGARGCSRISCGCHNFNLFSEHHNSPQALDRCQPIGRCVAGEFGGEVTCDCPPSHAGPRCEHCAPGRTDYPRCVEDGHGAATAAADTGQNPGSGAACGGPCHNGGVCDALLGVCKCSGHFGGVFCDKQLGDSVALSVSGGASLYMVYAATVVACVMVVAGLLLHYRARRGGLLRSIDVPAGVGGTSAGGGSYAYEDDGL